MFYLKEPKSDKYTLIYLIHRIDGKSMKMSTGEKIHPSDWDFGNNFPKRKQGDHSITAIRSVLRRLEEKVNSYVDSCKIKGLKPSIEGLKRNFYQPDTVTFNSYIKQFVKSDVKKRNGQPISRRTRQAYSTTSDYLDEYGTFGFDELDLKLHKGFTNFLESKGLALNTIGGYVKNLKVFAKHAKKEGYEVNEQILTSDFFVAEEKSESVYLDEEEINTLFNLKDLTEREDKVRKWAIIGVWTGLRVSDWEQFNPKDGFVEIETKKTGRKVVIPLHWQVKEVGMPKPCSDIEFNRVIKKVCEKAGFTQKVYGSRRNPETNRLEKGMIEKWKLISSHTCRRSFATNNYKMGIDTLTIMQVTGHTTEKNFLKYIKVTPREHAKRLQEKWDAYYSN